MATTCPTDTQTLTGSGMVQGLTVDLSATLPTYATDSFAVEATLNTSEITEDINIAVVIDTSGSTGGSSGSDVDGDGDIDTYLEAQIIAAQELFQSFVDAGYSPDEIEITLIEYNSGATTLGSYTLDQQDSFNAAVGGLTSGGLTNYEDGLQQVYDEWSAAGDVDAGDTNYLVFLSDGRPYPSDQDYSQEVSALQSDFNTQIIGIGVGDGASLNALNDLDNTGGAEKVTDVSQLVDTITGPVQDAEFEYFEVVVDGEVLGTFAADDPNVSTTPFGYTLNCVDIDGYPYIIGEDIEVEVRAVFDDGNDVVSVGTIIIPTVVCFLLGTRILTPAGLVAIEDLDEGDRVVTRDHGVQKLRWIGRTELSADFVKANPKLYPIRIRAGALGKDTPMRDLSVSRQHRLLVRDWRAEVMFGQPGGVFAPAHTLCNDDSIVTDTTEQTLVYFHLAFGQHEVVYAEGAEAESFHPCKETVAALSPAQREELFTLFPALAVEIEGAVAFDSARPHLKGHEGQLVGKLKRLA